MISTDRVARQFLAGIIAAAIVSTSLPATAKNAEAVEHFEAGRKLVREGRWQEAAAEFEQSLALEQAVGPLLNLGTAYEKLGRVASAAKAFRAAQQLASRTPGDEARASEAGARVRELEKEIPTVTFSAPPNVSLELRDVGAVSPDVAIPMDPGRHEVVVTSRDEPRRTVPFTLAAKDKLKVAIPSLDKSDKPDQPPPDQPPPRAATPSPAADTSTTDVLAYAAIGTGAAALVVGGVFGVLALGNKSELGDLCPRYPTCPSANANAAREADDALSRNGAVSTIGFAIGGVLVASGIVLYLVAPNARSASSARLVPGLAAARFEVSF
jgi:tetratricopeptide (TPR) repeat protein